MAKKRTIFPEPMKRQGAIPVWIKRNPEIYELMIKTDLRQYEIAHICGMHPDSFAKKLKFPLSDEAKEKIILTVENYLNDHPDSMEEVE